MQSIAAPSRRTRGGTNGFGPVPVSGTRSDSVAATITRITQDDTGVRYQVLLEKGWKVRLYGEYSHPDKPFRPRFQPELETAFAEPGKVEPLGFSIGYGFNRRPSSLLVATPTH